MAEKKSLTFEQRVRKEELRLEKLIQKVEETKQKTALGLVRRAAFMKVKLEDLEADIAENGLTEEFSQGDQEPYLRERPTSKIYNQMNNSYQKIIKQLTDALPKDEPVKPPADPFEEF